MLHQQNTLRDAMVAALTLDILVNRCDLVAMANLAQVANVLQSLLLIEGDRVVRTPTFHDFALHRPHRGGTAVRVDTVSDAISDGGDRAAAARALSLDRQPLRLRRLSAAASRSGDHLTITACNTHPGEACDVEIRIAGHAPAEAELVALTADGIHAHNTVQRPDTVGLSAPQRLVARDGVLRLRLEPAAIVRLGVPL